MSTDTPRRHHQPRVELRAAQPYAAITARARTEAEFRAAVDRDMPALFRWLAARGLTPAGSPFLRYLVVDETTIPDEGPPPAIFESGVPLAVRPDIEGAAGRPTERTAGRPAEPTAGLAIDGAGIRANDAVAAGHDEAADRHRASGAEGAPDVHAGELPAGPWIVTLHRGGYSGLARAHVLVHEWAADQGATVARREDPDGTAFRGAVEHFRIGPVEEPDPWRWETDVAYLLAD